MNLRSTLGAAALLLACAAPAAAQQPSAAAPCEDAAPLLRPQDRAFCIAIAQAVESTQPELGMLLSGGNPTLGTARPGGVRVLGGSRVSAALQLRAVEVRLPDIRDDDTALSAELRLAAPALSGTASVGLFRGFDASPTLGGIGALDLLGSATWLPFDVVDADKLSADDAKFTFGVGGRVGLLRESFGVPAVSASLMYRRMGRVRYGDICAAGSEAPLPLVPEGRGYDLAAGLCAVPGDPGEFSFDLTDWSARATVSKQFGGLGLAAGGGVDRFSSDIDFGFGAVANIPVVGARPVFVRASSLELEQDRWSAFANASYTFVVTTVGLEAGWMQGGNPLPGYDAATSAFDPEQGVLFGSVGLRITL